MANWKFWKTGAAEPAPAAEGSDAVGYVDALLRQMLRDGRLRMIISESTPLPELTDAESGRTLVAPSPAAALNRLKLLAKLNPFPYAEPVDGTYSLQRQEHTVVFAMRFDDRGTPPSCAIEMRIRRRTGGSSTP